MSEPIGWSVYASGNGDNWTFREFIPNERALAAAGAALAGEVERQLEDGTLAGSAAPAAIDFFLMHDPAEPPPEGFCRVYWGSHGCHHPRGHDPAVTPHQCDCCGCGEHHPYPDWPDTGVLCAAKPPYYGPGTRFYGEEAEALGLPLADGS